MPPETLSPIWWIAIDPAKPKEPKKFEAVTYPEARSVAAKWFRLDEMAVKCRAMYDYEIAAMLAKKAEAA